MVDEKPIYFSMKMSDGFIALGAEEKKQLAKKMVTETLNARELSKDDLMKLMVTAREKNSIGSQ
jgi:hypothetical protein